MTQKIPILYVSAEKQIQDSSSDEEMALPIVKHKASKVHKQKKNKAHLKDLTQKKNRKSLSSSDVFESSMDGSVNSPVEECRKPLSSSDIFESSIDTSDNEYSSSDEEMALPIVKHKVSKVHKQKKNKAHLKDLTQKKNRKSLSSSDVFESSMDGSVNSHVEECRIPLSSSDIFESSIDTSDNECMHHMQSTENEFDIPPSKFDDSAEKYRLLDSRTKTKKTVKPENNEENGRNSANNGLVCVHKESKKQTFLDNENDTGTNMNKNRYDFVPASREKYTEIKQNANKSGVQSEISVTDCVHKKSKKRKLKPEADKQAVKRKINYNSDDLTAIGKESNGQHVSKRKRNHSDNDKLTAMENESNSDPASKRKRNISNSHPGTASKRKRNISNSHPATASKRKRNISNSHPATASKRKRNISRPTINGSASKTVDMSHVALTNEKTAPTTSPSQTCNVQTAVSDSEEEIVSDDSESNGGTRNLSGNNSNSSERTETSTKHIEKSNKSRTLKTSADSLTTSIKISRIQSSACDELHSLNAVSWGVNRKIKEQMAASGTPVRTGTWLPEEDHYLRENIEHYKLANPTVDVHHLLFGEKTKLVKGRIIKSTRFYECMCRGLMRTCYDCYQRVRKVLYANNDVTGVYSDKEENQLRWLYAQHGPDWKKIGNELGRRPQSVLDKYNNMQTKNHGVWSHQESDKLVSTMELFVKKEGKNAKADLQDNMPWSEISKHVPGRTAAQCRHHWMVTLRKNYLAATDKQKKWEDKDKLFLLEEISVQKVARDADIDFDVIRSHFESKGQFVSKPSLRRNWLRLKQTVPGHSMKSFPALVDMLLEQY